MVEVEPIEPLELSTALVVRGTRLEQIIAAGGATPEQAAEFVEESNRRRQADMGRFLERHGYVHKPDESHVLVLARHDSGFEQQVVPHYTLVLVPIDRRHEAEAGEPHDLVDRHPNLTIPQDIQMSPSTPSP